MQPTVIKATELRNHAREIMERAKYKSEHFLVKTFGRPMAVIISVEEYQRLATLDAEGQVNKSTPRNNVSQ